MSDQSAPKKLDENVTVENIHNIIDPTYPDDDIAEKYGNDSNPDTNESIIGS